LGDWEVSYRGGKKKKSPLWGTIGCSKKSTKKKNQDVKKKQKEGCSRGGTKNEGGDHKNKKRMEGGREKS